MLKLDCAHSSLRARLHYGPHCAVFLTKPQVKLGCWITEQDMIRLNFPLNAPLKEFLTEIEELRSNSDDTSSRIKELRNE